MNYSAYSYESFKIINNQIKLILSELKRGEINDIY